MQNRISKLVVFVFVVLLMTGAKQMNAQSNIPNAVNFQSIARDGSGNLVTNTNIEVQFTILDGGPLGTALRQPRFIRNTDQFGQFSLTLSEDSATSFGPSGATPIPNIDWASGNKWIKIEFRPNLISPYTLIETIRCNSTFYAFAAKSAEIAASIEIPGTNGQVLKHNGTTWVAGTDDVGLGISPGIIVPFGGTIPPSGWLLCDGSQVSRTGIYAGLFAAIGTAFGSGNGTTTFHLPDFRGMFLRGLDGTANVDPDKATRTANNPGGNSGNNVGSEQQDAFQGHGHSLERQSDGNPVGSDTGTIGTIPGSSVNVNGATPTIAKNAITDGVNGLPRISSESRSKNVYVNYIVKY